MINIEKALIYLSIGLLILGISLNFPKCIYFDETWLYDEKLLKIPHDIDILITHGPAHGILDKAKRYNSNGYWNPKDGKYEHVGNKSLYAWLKYVARPKLHVFGHIHESYGKIEELPTHNDKMMISVNASHVNENYEPVNKPIRIII